MRKIKGRDSESGKLKELGCREGVNVYDNALFYPTDTHYNIYRLKDRLLDFLQNTLGQKESEKGEIKQERHEDSLYCSLQLCVCLKFPVIKTFFLRLRERRDRNS